MQLQSGGQHHGYEPQQLLLEQVSLPHSLLQFLYCTCSIPNSMLLLTFYCTDASLHCKYSALKKSCAGLLHEDIMNLRYLVPASTITAPKTKTTCYYGLLGVKLKILGTTFAPCH